MNPDQSEQDLQRAAKAYKKSDGSRWVFAFYASRIVGRNEDFVTKRLADSIGVSSDTVEDHAHAFWIFDKLRNMGDRAERLYVQTARKLPYIHYSHFRALYDLQISRHLSDDQIMNLLIDIVQSEGGISSRNLEDHANSRYGDTRTWEYYGRKALKELTKTIGHPGLLVTSESIGKLYAVVLDVEKQTSCQYFVLAYSPVMAEKVARVELGKTVNEETVRSAKLNSINEIDIVVSSSKHILNIAGDWLGDNA